MTFVEPGKVQHITYENKDRDFRLDMYEGKEYAFNNLSIRDRSWGENRQEEGHKIPPYTWMNGAFSEDFAFTIAGLDDPKLNPDWAGLYDIPESMLLSDAWIYDHGKKIRLTRLSKITHRAEDGLRPMRNIIDCDTDDGRSFRFEGEIVASLPWHSWQFDNVGWGETQEVQWNDWIAKMAKPV